MMKHVMRMWQEMQPLEEPQPAGWCDTCALPSHLERRFLHSMHAGEAVTYAQVLTLVVCDTCERAYWKEYREAANHDTDD